MTVSERKEKIWPHLLAGDIFAALHFYARQDVERALWELHAHVRCLYDELCSFKGDDFSEFS